MGAELASSLLSGTFHPIAQELPNASRSRPRVGWSSSDQLTGIVAGIAVILLGGTCFWKPEPVADWFEDRVPQDVTPSHVKRMGAVLLFAGAALLIYATIGQMG